MARKSGFTLLLLVFCGLIFFCVSTHADERTNWIAFNGTGGVFKYIMAVDEEGNILVPATPILSYDIQAFSNNGEPVNPYIDGRGDSDDDGGPSATDDPIPAPPGPLDGPCAIALSDNGGSINYYLLTAQGSIFKFDLPKSTLVPTTTLPKAVFKRTQESKIRDFRTLQATQHVSNRSLAMIFGNVGKDTNCSPCIDNVLNPSLRSFGFNADGSVKAKGKDISPLIAGLAKIGSISSDGLMSVANQEIGSGNFDDTQDCSPEDNDKAGSIFVTPLASNGKPSGASVNIGNSKPQVGAVDVSNEVVPGVRYVVYATRSSDTPDTQNGDDLVLQMVNSHTGAKIGGKHLLQEDVEMDMTFFQGVAVDPEGEFVIFTKRPINSTIGDGGECGGSLGNGANIDGHQTGNRDSLFFQAVDIRTGDAFGKPILLFSADDGPFNGQSDEDNSVGNVDQEFAFPQINGIDVMIDE